jgi:hypothetical protein
MTPADEFVVWDEILGGGANDRRRKLRRPGGGSQPGGSIIETFTAWDKTPAAQCSALGLQESRIALVRRIDILWEC